MFSHGSEGREQKPGEREGSLSQQIYYSIEALGQ